MEEMNVMTQVFILVVGYGLIMIFGKRFFSIEIVDAEEFEYLKYLKFMQKTEPRIMKKRLKELRKLNVKQWVESVTG